MSLKINSVQYPSLPEVRQRILAWFDLYARDLPWRRTADPYAIWVSEIMLQQTQVATVIDYYQRFLAALPTVQSLAAAEEQDVLRLWAGLGYYRRARQMHAAAKLIAAGTGHFPTTFDSIEKLPGIGRYTAGAIASFAFDHPTPIVEANTQRLFSRLLRLEVDPRTRAGQTHLWTFAEALLADNPSQGAGRINQSVIELGSQICTARNPDCLNCPLKRLCPTFADGLQAVIPKAAPKKVMTELTHVALLILDNDELLLRQNGAEEWWHGLWDLPRLDVTAAKAFDNKDFSSRSLDVAGSTWLAGELQRLHGLKCSIAQHHSTLKHSVTRYRITLHSYFAILKGRRRPPTFSWQTFATALALPLTAPAKRIIRSL